MNTHKFLSKTTINIFCVLILVCVFQGTCFASDPVPSERKTLIITGASGALGGAAARFLAQDYDLILTGRNVARLKNLQQELQAAHPGHYEFQTLDYISKSSIENFKNYLAQTNAHIGGLLIIYPRPVFYGKALIQDESVWLTEIKTNFTGPLEALKVILPFMSNPSKIVVIAGTTSVQFQPETGPSCVIRRMWTSYTKALSHQLGSQGISINTLSPGIVLTEYHEERIQKKANDSGISFDAQMNKEVANIPMHRLAKPQEVAQTIKFLLSEQSDFITGVNLLLDGGLNLSY